MLAFHAAPPHHHRAELGASTKRDLALKPRTRRPLSLTQVREGHEKHNEQMDIQMASQLRDELRRR